ncbi:competence damage-inducible protein A [Agromyces rhizosphaerae]|uniref:Competence damage-inducible protein A n=1 Tax=Agromyces rhizosphaerae TaxID=88374 RepID=A0A9W6CV34_9MICO|nr:CinA family protein [Agromyces rhizosphaerae]GLI25807.1 competence damage-inducible protein A [Agromyces rhizosphaerae]
MPDDARSLVEALAARGMTLAVAESLTGGMLAARIVDVPGASAVFVGGVVAYATKLKHDLLGVDATLLVERGPVDAEVARRLAEGVRRACAVDGREADLGVATTGVAGPDPQGGMPPGTVFVGVATDAGSRAVELALTGDRAAIRTATVDAAIAEAVAEVRNRRR